MSGMRAETTSYMIKNINNKNAAKSATSRQQKNWQKLKRCQLYLDMSTTSSKQKAYDRREKYKNANSFRQVSPQI